MVTMRHSNKDFSKELTFKFSRSSGPGGQNVNKVNTRVEAILKIDNSALLSIHDKNTLRHKLKNRISNDGELKVASETERSQLKNKTLAIQKINQLIHQALKKDKKRIASKPTLSSKKARLESKKQQGQKKILRRKPDF